MTAACRQHSVGAGLAASVRPSQQLGCDLPRRSGDQRRRLPAGRARRRVVEMDDAAASAAGPLHRRHRRHRRQRPPTGTAACAGVLRRTNDRRLLSVPCTYRSRRTTSVVRPDRNFQRRFQGGPLIPPNCHALHLKFNGQDSKFDKFSNRPSKYIISVKFIPTK